MKPEILIKYEPNLFHVISNAVLHSPDAEFVEAIRQKLPH